MKTKIALLVFVLVIVFTAVMLSTSDNNKAVTCNDKPIPGLMVPTCEQP